MKRILLVLLVSACSSEDPGECENSLTLGDSDSGMAHVIDDGCTSLIVTLANDPLVTRDSTPMVDPNVLRFDYRLIQSEGTSYYFTPMGNGSSLVLIGAQPATWEWSATVQISLPQ